MKNTPGRPIDLSDINIPEIEDYTKDRVDYRNYIKCQTFISLNNGNSMHDVCKVLGITRETVRKWKGQLRSGGINELVEHKKVGKRYRVDNEKLFELKKIIKQKPAKFGYKGKRWTGKLVMDYVQLQWGIKISIRTAQLWIKHVRNL